ncbi:T9SS type A sorting domain-containing protein [Autumnicola musiva]|uniref:T9SS type A sorting domain-containing protein n=1 Tax=Autumnicola musiva TaxID=3075589 RepID=A0ABU3D2T5_9FLAO|nr:T9SS type A sorting domain-containing protein [Zunongwangia sp. F117]MDT0675850.1 T9SS type A sorting domain-containing protein [Zunongwangia sp. F117]
MNCQADLSSANYSANKNFIHAFTASGGDGNEENGSIAFSLGQPFYTASQSHSIHIQEGVQQFFSEETGESPDVIQEKPAKDSRQAEPEITVYPNPFTEYFFVKTFNKNREYSFELFDMQGKILMHGSLEGSTAKIYPGHLQPALYILKISNKSSLIRSFTIIKK